MLILKKEFKQKGIEQFWQELQDQYKEKINNNILQLYNISLLLNMFTRLDIVNVNFMISASYASDLQKIISKINSLSNQINTDPSILQEIAGLQQELINITAKLHAEMIPLIDNTRNTLNALIKGLPADSSIPIDVDTMYNLISQHPNFPGDMWKSTVDFNLDLYSRGMVIKENLFFNLGFKDPQELIDLNDILTEVKAQQQYLNSIENTAQQVTSYPTTSVNLSTSPTEPMTTSLESAATPEPLMPTEVLNNELGLILGVTVGVIALIAAGGMIVGILVKKHKKNKVNSNDGDNSIDYETCYLKKNIPINSNNPKILQTANGPIPIVEHGHVINHPNIANGESINNDQSHRSPRTKRWTEEMQHPTQSHLNR